MARTLSTSFLEGELEERQASAIRGHLRQCDSCREAFDDEATLATIADELEILDPPSSLWQGIEARLAEEENADAGRSRAWFWWRGAWSRAQVHVAGAAVAACAGLVLWTALDRDAEPPPASVEAPVAPAVIAEPTLTFGEAREAEVLRAEARYSATISELATIADEERELWAAHRVAAFDKQVAHFEAEIARHRRTRIDGAASDGDRRELYAVYRAKIDFLQRAALGEDLP